MTQPDPTPAPPTAPDESALLARVRAGDRTALNELLAAYQGRLYNICLRMVGNRDDAAEATQEALLKAVQHIDRFRGEAKLSTWLIRIATNEATTHLRRRRIRRAASLEASHDGQTDGDAHTLRHRLTDQREPPPEQRVQQDETLQRIEAALDQLDPDFRAVLVLRDIDQMDYQQIAEVLETPIGTVKSRLFRARLALREQLTETERPDNGQAT
ncbi:MAG: RNA polymerase sigma factor [Phycisphaeraceae bacterium]